MNSGCIAALVLVIVLLGFGPATFAQVAITGKIAGTVTDSSGAGVPGATVTVQGSALMAPRVATTQSDGSFFFDFVDIGTYDVTVAAKGFKTALEKGVAITAGFSATLNIALTVGEVQETVEVSGEAPIVDVRSNATPSTFDQTLLQDIPSGRDPWSTVAQAPGTLSSNYDVGGNQSFQQAVMQVHGSKPGEQVYSFDGLRLNWPGSSGGFTAFYIDHDSLQEFQVVTDSAPAEVGVGGVYMNMVTKSGSNQVHGMAALYYTSAAFHSGEPSLQFGGQPDPVGSPMIMNRDSTVNAGAPLMKDRWWIFGAYRRYDIKESILAIPKPASEGGGPIADTNHQTNTVLRTDFQINAKNRVNFQWLYNNQNRFFRRDTAFQFVDEQASWRQIEPAYIVQGQWTSQITNNFLLDARLGYLHLLFPLGYQPTVTPTDINLQDFSFQTEKGAAPFNYLNPAQTLRAAVSASYYRGAFLYGTHNFKFGYEVGKSKNGNVFNVNGDINAQFNGGQALDVIIYNTPVREQAIFHDSAFFLQDAWTVKQRLTLNLGFRFDHFRTFNPAQSSPGTGTFSSLFPNRTFPQSPDVVVWNNVAPRIGGAFDVTGKGRSVIRASYSRFYRIEGTEIAEAVNANGLGGQGYIWTDSNGDGFPQSSEFLSPSNLIFSFGGIATRIDPNLKHPYSDQVSVGYEQQVYKDLHVGVTYFYRTNKDQVGQRNMAILPTDYTPITTLNGQPITNPLTNQPLTLFSANQALVGQSDLLVTNIPALDDNAYHGVEFTAVKRFSSRWQVLAGFTIQREKGTWANPNGITADNFNDPNLDINRKNSYLDFDSTYIFKLGGTYDLPWHFTTSANFQHYTGYPIQPNLVFSDTRPLAQRELKQGSETVALQAAGTSRLPSVNLLSFRISRPFSVWESRLTVEPLVDLLNIGNSQTVVSEVTSFGSAYLKPSDLLHPFVAKFGLRVKF
ncbi:MAG TPA: TonB-dependent receptor [Candidatus Acidoferrum sp.]|nr:TonB-dependent receptor [Candidatus Acidoferrum sp.]